MLTEPTVLPVTESQQGLLVVDGQVSCRHLYNELVRFDLDPAFPPEAVERALGVVVALQPAMRQVFAVLPEMHATLMPPDIPAVERVVAPAHSYEKAVADTARRLCLPAFDLAAGPLYRFATVRAADGSASALLLCDHHVILDGLSMAALAADLEAGLTGRVDADRASREAAFARELAAQARAAANAPEADAWAERLRDVPPLVLAPLPGRPAQTAWKGARVAWRLDARDAEALGQTCRRLDITPFVALTGIYGAVLARHGGVSRVLVGSPFMARRTVASFDLGGFFVNTLPVTVDVDWDRTADEHLASVVRDAVDFCRANVDLPFSRLVAAAAPERTSDRNPLFSALLAMQESEPRTGPVRRITELPNGTAKFDLRLNATPVDGTWLLELEYDTELIGPSVADALLASLRTALRRALDDGTRRLRDLFTDASAALSVRSDGWVSALPGPSPVEWVEAAAPATIAIESPARRLTYGELAAEAGRVAAGLAQRGIGPHDVVGVVAGDLADTAIAILAILRRGAAYLPLDPSLPAGRLAYMTAQAACELVIGEGRTELAELRLEDSVAAETGDHLPAYVMFTSGSTGRPKGVLMGRRPLANLTAWQVAALAMDEHTRFFQYAPISFDVSFQELLAPLAAGATVVSREPADRRDLPALLERIAHERITHLYLPVPVLGPLLELAHRLPDLRCVCVAGEQLLVSESTRAFFDAHPQCALVNMYGPTETHVATARRLSAIDPPWPAHVPIGLPIPGATAYVIDVTGHLAPPGVAGELLLGGVSPADGYVNDPERTAERFIDRDGERVYRTGDLVLRDDRGELVFLGRADRQVKIRGYRVEPGEIEVAAGAVAGVRHAVAVVAGDGADRRLVLFIEGEADLDAVGERILEELPSYMRPARIHAIERIPTTASGKTDRDALVRLADEPVPDPVASDYADQLERELAEIWGEILGVDGIPREDAVLQHGAHSLNIFTALAQVQERYGVAVPMADFFRSPTIATLARLVRGA